MKRVWVIGLFWAAACSSSSDETLPDIVGEPDTRSDTTQHEVMAWSAPCKPGPIAGKVLTPFKAPTECRPLNEEWTEGEPLRLPCVPTKEACDLVDNDNDGITDPHCPTLPCRSDGDCTLGGLLADADCDDWGSSGPECNQIDGAPLGAPTHDCWGMLCPPGLKCFAGDCIEPGTKLPNEPCTSGSECPIHAGCIPDTPGKDSTARCRYVCDDWACPPGWACEAHTSTLANGVTVTHRTCTDPYLCEEARTGCAEWVDACADTEACATAASCLLRCVIFPEAGCEANCGHPAGSCSLPGLVATCQSEVCPKPLIPDT